jgi:hypothetical protein
VTLKLTADGKMVYENPAQAQRMEKTPMPGVEYPTSAVALREGVVHTKDAVHAGVGGR